MSPSLAGWLSTPEGRLFVAQAVLAGPFRVAEVGGKTFSGLMPPYARRLKDADLVAVLRYVGESLNRPAPGYKPFDLALMTAARKLPTTTQALKDARAKLPPR